MYNWSVDTTRLQQNPEKYEIFKLEQAINFGLNNTKISAKKLKRHWQQLSIDPTKKRYLHSLLWE